MCVWGGIEFWILRLPFNLRHCELYSVLCFNIYVNYINWFIMYELGLSATKKTVRREFVSEVAM